MTTTSRRRSVVVVTTPATRQQSVVVVTTTTTRQSVVVVMTITTRRRSVNCCCCPDDSLLLLLSWLLLDDGLWLATAEAAEETTPEALPRVERLVRPDPEAGRDADDERHQVLHHEDEEDGRGSRTRVGVLTAVRVGKTATQRPETISIIYISLEMHNGRSESQQPLARGRKLTIINDDDDERESTCRENYDTATCNNKYYIYIYIYIYI